MDRTWWTVWIKVAVLAAVLLVAFLSVKKLVMDTLDPYLLQEPAQIQTDGAEDGEEGEEPDPVQTLVGKAEKLLGVHIDYENFIFDFANQYAKDMMAQSEQEHNQISQPLS